MPSISNLPTLTTASDNIYFPVVDTWPNPDITKKSTFGQFRSYLENSVSVKSVAGKTGTVTLSYVDISGLSTAAHSGSFTDLLNRPSTYPVSTATTSTLGGVIVGSGINLTNGVISVSPLAVATDSVLGGVKVGSGISFTEDGTISTVPLVTATNTVLGGIKIGAGLTIDKDGVVTVNTQSSNVLASFLVINANETASYVNANSGTAFWQSAGLVIYRGSSPAARMGYTDDYTINNGTTSSRGIFALYVGTTQTDIQSSGLIINNLRTSIGVNELNIFGTNNPNAVITVNGTTNYETNVTNDDHIPNKKYVDDAVVASTSSVINIITSTYATSSIYGVVKVGSGISVASGVISVTPYSLVTATNVRLGGIKVGTGLSASGDGTLNVVSTYVLTTATASALGGVKIGTGISITADGTISATTATPYSLPTASDTVLGGIKVGANLSIDGSGVLSSVAAFTGGSVANSTQFIDTTASSNTTTGAVTIAGGLGVQGDVNVGKNVNVWNTVTAQSFVYTGSNTPEVYSASNLNLTAVGRVQVTQSPFKVWNVTTAERDAIAASNGDMIYNTDVHKFQGYANGTWKDMSA